jgi:hypothetical protein
MIKKIALGLIFTLITGVLIVGAANRTTAKTEQYNPAETVAQTGDGGGQNRDSERQYANQHEPLYLEKEQTGQNDQRQGGQGQGNGRSNTNGVPNNETNSPLGGQGQGNVAGNGQGNGAQNQDADRYGNLEAPISHEMLTFSGVVTTAPAAGVELVIRTDEGDLTIGTGPSYWLEANITLAVDDTISVTGFWEDDEFKATSLTRLSDNLTVILRDETGRPQWSGSMRNTSNGQGQGQGRGQAQGQGNGNQ